MTANRLKQSETHDSSWNDFQPMLNDKVSCNSCLLILSNVEWVFMRIPQEGILICLSLYRNSRYSLILKEVGQQWLGRLVEVPSRNIRTDG